MSPSRSWMVWMAPLCAAAMILLGPSAAFADPVNVAVAGTASQSTIGWGMPADRANDGDLGNISHTDGSEAAPAVAWWEVDLGGTLPIERVVASLG